MIETLDKKNGLETTHGYFKLDEKSPTKLDLRSYEKARVKWLYFTAMKPKNPQHRAWLNAIRGPAFGQPHLHGKIILTVFIHRKPTLVLCSSTPNNSGYGSQERQRQKTNFCIRAKTYIA
jgi:hypothetical protein